LACLKIQRMEFINPRVFFWKELFLIMARAVLEKSKINFKQELRMLLPKSHHMILSDFKNVLRRETAQRIK